MEGPESEDDEAEEAEAPRPVRRESNRRFTALDAVPALKLTPRPRNGCLRPPPEADRLFLRCPKLGPYPLLTAPKISGSRDAVRGADRRRPVQVSVVP